ncbi:hypothetical protein C8R43DRAFT_1243730 [Mycena crocata]|nr:hypothetical protein C8R43DRAFT_1243730 [Mycena crocata]
MATDICVTLAPHRKYLTVYDDSTERFDSNKKCLAHLLFHLREQSTGTVEGDILKLSELIAGLVEELGLKSMMREYTVPKEDIPKIAHGLGGKEVEGLLDGIY